MAQLTGRVLEPVDEVVDGVDDLLLDLDVGLAAAGLVVVVLLGGLAVQEALQQGRLGLEPVLDELAGVATAACKKKKNLTSSLCIWKIELRVILQHGK